MTTAIAEKEHKHHFKVRYKLVDGLRIMIDPVCQCSGCEQQAIITVDGYRVAVTFVSSASQVSYDAILCEARP